MNKFEKRNKKINQMINNNEILDVFEKVANDMELERTSNFSDEVIKYSVDDLSQFEFDMHSESLLSYDDPSYNRRQRLIENLYKGPMHVFSIKPDNQQEPEGRIHRLVTNMK